MLVLDVVAILGVLAGSASLGHEVLWILAILILPVIGMVLYFRDREEPTGRLTPGAPPSPRGDPREARTIPGIGGCLPACENLGGSSLTPLENEI